MECPICLEIFNVPLLLPGCGHTICQICAEALVYDGNFLKCPECRLVYQLRRGIKSLPKNVAMQRTIEDHKKLNSSVSNRTTAGTMCENHPEDNVTLYCRTCDKPICLKCYFTNTLRKGESLHSGHQVDTSDDMLFREKRLLEQICKKAESFVVEEDERLANLKDTEERLMKVLDLKNSEIEAKKNALINAIKLTAKKLNFNLEGSVIREKECLKSSIDASEECLASLKNAITHAISVLNLNMDEKSNIQALKMARKKTRGIFVYYR